ncbi:hypothetical protein Tco_0838796 [Tanacetum coccineum]|uniref:Uncharacterized protein n=1 Tax=Tanacetum coccineum TaxID=301880 RepID=A0ABQ5ATC8_9ASTR
MANNETYTYSPSKVCLSDSDSDLLIPTPWSDESKNEKRAKRSKGKNMKDIDMPSEVVEQGMDVTVPNEIDGAKGE